MDLIPYEITVTLKPGYDYRDSRQANYYYLSSIVAYLELQALQTDNLAKDNTDEVG